MSSKIDAIRAEFGGKQKQKQKQKLMKKIIEPVPTSDVISLEDVLETKFPIVGFLHEGNQKGFLVPDRFYGLSSKTEAMRYTARAVQSFSAGNGWNLSESQTLKKWKTFFGNSAEFFLFENEKEMFKWLSE